MDSCSKKKEIYQYIILPTIKLNVSNIIKTVCYILFDFSSVLSSKRAHEATCAFPETHNCDVVCCTFNPKTIPIDVIEKQYPHARKRMKKLGMKHMICTRNITFFAISKEREVHSIIKMY